MKGLLNRIGEANAVAITTEACGLTGEGFTRRAVRSAIHFTAHPTPTHPIAQHPRLLRARSLCLARLSPRVPAATAVADVKVNSASPAPPQVSEAVTREIVTALKEGPRCSAAYSFALASFVCGLATTARRPPRTHTLRFRVLRRSAVCSAVQLLQADVLVVQGGFP